jgi:translation initiation factor 1 (eIF-1/SUI1)
MLDEFENSKNYNQKFLKKIIDDKKFKKKNPDLNMNNNLKLEDLENSSSDSDKMVVKSKYFKNNIDDSESEEECEEIEDKGILSYEKKKSPQSTKSNGSSNITSTYCFNDFLSNELDLNNNDNFLSGEAELNYEIDQEIYIKKIMRQKKTNKFDTIIIGLNMNNDTEINNLLRKIKTKFGIGGYKKEIQDPDTKKLLNVLVLNADYPEKIKDFLVKELKRSEDSIIIQ